ncbi:MAG: TIGR02444 family protein [Asticcacaulis sp.]
MAVYGDAEVAALCLDLQDTHGQCVPLMLWAAWCPRAGLRIGSDAARQASGMARAWSDEVIAPLRGVRRRLKAALNAGDDEARLPLRQAVKAAELQAEKALMAQLEALAPGGMPVPVSNLAAARLDSLLAVAAAWSADDPADVLARLTEALTKAEILRYNGEIGGGRSPLDCPLASKP